MMQELIDLFTTSPTAEIAWSVVLSALAAGAISPVLVMHRMAFLSESVAHSVLLGVPLGILVGMSDTGAMLGVAFIVGFAILYLRSQTQLSVDSILGVLMAGSLALAVILYQQIATGRDLHSYLFGDIALLPKAWLLPLGLVTSAVVVFAILSFNRLAMTAIARDLVHARGKHASRYDAMLIVVLALVVTFGVRVMGVLMITALLVVPAAAARSLCRSLTSFFWSSIVIALLAAVSGFVICYRLEYAPGASIVAVLVAMFFVSVIVSKVRARLS